MPFSITIKLNPNTRLGRTGHDGQNVQAWRGMTLEKNEAHFLGILRGNRRGTISKDGMISRERTPLPPKLQKMSSFSIFVLSLIFCSFCASRLFFESLLFCYFSYFLFLLKTHNYGAHLVSWLEY
eukprot:GEMP01092689.1.p1 GENE.GEMP01092689.1~~GEMP01092689.1.p1  ORF type:complete len:125 (-),score=3.95 GEMP01092689.1:287-661(-)